MTSSALPVSRERRAIPLAAITGRSPSNCRNEAPDAELAGLAASIDALGMLQPLLVSRVIPATKPVTYWIDDGGRRYDALKLLCAGGKLSKTATIDCDVADHDEGTARENSLAANIMRRSLHPVDECEAFDGLNQAGVTVEKIASDFGVTVRQVRQRLKLTTLSPRVRDLWRAGTIGLEAAQAMTVARSHAQQDELLDAGAATPWLLRDPEAIRKRLTGAVMRGDEAEAVYLGLEAYVEAGGTLDENLFQDHPLILDPPLLRRLARNKMMREGEVLLERDGYGFCLFRDDVEMPWAWSRLKPDYTAEESKKLQELGDANTALEIEDEDEHDAAVAAIEAEVEAIEARALLRGNDAATRRSAGILLSLDTDGRLVADCGLIKPATARTTPSDETDAPAAGRSKAKKAEKPKDPIEAAATVKSVRAVLEHSILAAIAATVGRRPDLALMIAVAKFGGTYASTWMHHMGTNFGISPYHKEKAPGSKDPLDRINAADFDKAIMICAGVPTADLSVAFARIVGQSIRIDPTAPLAALEPLMTALAHRGAALRQAFQEAIDYEAYFAAASKAACLAACEEMLTSLVSSGNAKADLARIATEDAKAKTWLPQPLARWAAIEAVSPEVQIEPAGEDAKPPQTLAEAMAAAIDDDEARDPLPIEDKIELNLTAFLNLHCARDAAFAIKASALHEAYMAAEPDFPLSIRNFGEAIAALGFEKTRKKTGVHYRGLMLKDEVPA